MKTVNQLRSSSRVACECEAVFGMWCKHEVEAVVAAAREESPKHVCSCSNDPCPKCGGDGPSGDWFEGAEVICDDCGAELVVVSTDPCKGRSAFELAECEKLGESEDTDFDRNTCPGCGGGCQVACR